jgi:hypothetical protein
MEREGRITDNIHIDFLEEFDNPSCISPYIANSAKMFIWESQLYQSLE